MRRGAVPVMLGFLLALGLLGCDGQDPTTPPEEEREPMQVPRMLELSGDLEHVHDPAIIEAHGDYYLFSTGGGIQWRSSPHRTAWTLRGDMLGGVPAWAQEAIPGVEDLWAPDIAYFNGRYHLYYAASTFGSGRSAIGVATNPVLHPDARPTHGPTPAR